MRLRPEPLCLLTLLSACGGEASEGSVEPPPATEEPSVSDDSGAGPGLGLWFVDATDESGLGSFRQVCGDPNKPFIVETIGGGVALCDVDRDGDLDAYLTNGSFFGADTDSAPADALYLNDGTGRFHDATVAAGLGDRSWTTGVRVVDYDADGWPDLYLTNYGPNVLMRNRGDGTFEDVTERAGVGDPRWSTGACFLDFDRDGDLDLYVANYVDFDEERMLRDRPTVSYKGVSVMKGPRGLPEAPDTFYINEGDGTFRDASAEVGIRGKPFFGFQCIAFDVNHDDWVDVYVANDSVENLLWKNDGGRRFENAAFLSGLAVSMSGKPQAGMGVGIGDYDGDQIVDLYVTNFADDYFTLYRGTKRGGFVDVTHRLRLADVTKPYLGWGCGFEDFDADGDLEIFVADGHVYPQVDELDVGS
ncbi:MAG TPA: VCBS repeat-containing protein, partial [Planctomycetes bacterium]|nr:VCBS repeat-containing protein [Planctomycetota bacterium]